ncbi:hypothetical protein [Glaciibacter sp. 2TAF33]|uniref:hypothetical protein n=1 Tax=Glaciibacter sp. 2TAF33 TaxID=3233015 RepID=UPI003F8EF3EA
MTTGVLTAVLRIGLWLLAAVELVLGIWTAFFPRNFYDTVPTVNLTPPFSEHLLRDFGGASIGIALALGAAALWPETRLVVVSLLAYLAFAVPHLVFHVGHLHGASDQEAALLVVTLALSVVLPVALVAVAVVRWRRRQPEPRPLPAGSPGDRPPAAGASGR